MQIHLVEAEHFSVPGLIRKAYHSLDDANREAAEIVNIMLADTTSMAGDSCTAKDWGTYMAKLQDYHGAQYCYVMIVTLDVN